MESLLVVLLVANLAGLFLIWQRQDKQEKYLTKSLEDQADNLSDQLDYRFEQARQGLQCQRMVKPQVYRGGLHSVDLSTSPESRTAQVFRLKRTRGSRESLHLN